MKKHIHYSITGLLTFFSFLIFLSCPTPEPEKIYYDDWYPYEPHLAKAELVRSMDITESFENFTGIGEIKANVHDIAVHGDYVYIRTYWYIKIYNKNTMEHIRTVEMDFKTEPIHYSGHYGGLVVSDDFVLVLVNSYVDLFEWPNINEPLYYNRPYFLFLDLDKSEFEIVDAGETLNISLESRIKSIAGFDKENNLLWIRQGAYDESLFHFYSFDRETQSFIFQKTKNGFVSGDHWSYYSAQAVAIHDSRIWSGYIGDVWNAALERRDIDNPEKILQTIKINHLGLHKYIQNLPSRFAYDGDYIYLTVIDRFEGRDIVKLLKIRPNDVQDAAVILNLDKQTENYE